jgi:DNA-binding LacI/PurR family transcriptional regulator
MKTKVVKSDTHLRRRPATAHEVARHAGVSQSAVSRAFTTGASIGMQTRAKVMEAAKRLGYRPNLVARSLITRRSNIVGIAVPVSENPFYYAALDALSLAFANIGYRVLLFTVDPVAGSDPVLEEVLRYRVDGLVLISTSLSSHFADECMQLGLPVIHFNRKTDSRCASSVTGDNLHGARMIAAFLHAAGHKRFGFIAGLDDSSTGRDREAGYTGYLRAQGITSIERRPGNYSTAQARLAVRSLLDSGKRPDAMFCASDHMAIVALDVAQTEFGLMPGKDISIAGFDNIDLAGWRIFGLTTYSQPIPAMVAQTIRLLQCHFQRDTPATAHYVMPGELIVRSSARKPKTGLIQSNGQWVWRPGKTSQR